jgi:RNA polymerase sigma factor (TIGR02999 family)
MLRLRASYESRARGGPMTESDAAPLADATPRATDAMFETVYARLKAMAGRQLAQQPARATLDTTMLVHELYLRIQSNRELVFEHDAQFFAYAARAMRHLLADRARDRLRLRAGGEWLRVTLTGGDDDAFALESAEEALALEEALGRLTTIDARAAQVVELRYFAGLSLEQAAVALGFTRRTIDRDWRFARAFLKSELD